MDALSAGLDQLKRQAASSNEQDVQLRALERDAKSQRDLLESYLAKYREATARDSIGAASPDARIISAAAVSNTPSWPKKLPTVLVAALAMFMLSAGFILTSQLLSAVPVQPAPVASDSTVAARRLAHIARAEPREPPGFSDVSAAESTASGVPLDTIRGLARALAAGGEASRRITVAGALRNVGTTLTAIGLARDLARRGRVVLLDLALGAPNLSVIAAEPGAPGIGELVRGTASVGDIITRDRDSQVHLIMAGQVDGDPQAIMASERLAITLEALARSYEYVVIDVGALADAALERFAILAPRAVLVASELDSAATGLASERLMEAGFSNVTVLAGQPAQSVADGTRAAA